MRNAVHVGAIILVLCLHIPASLAQQGAEAGVKAPAGGEAKAAGDQPAANEPPANEPAVSGHEGPLSPTDKIVAKFMALDTDADEGVSFEEYMTMVQERARARYDVMDADGDGEVTSEEYRNFWKSRMAQWYRLKR